MAKDVNFYVNNKPEQNSIRCGEILWNYENFQIYCIQCTKHSNNFTSVLEFIQHTAKEHLKLDYKSFDDFLGNEKAPESADLKLKMESYNEDLTSDDIRHMLFDNFDSALEKKAAAPNNFKEFLSEDKIINKKNHIKKTESDDRKPTKRKKRKKVLKIRLSATKMESTSISKSIDEDNEDSRKFKTTGAPSARPERMPCEICGKVFNKYRMSSHLRSHDPDRFAFKCTACEKLFVNQKNLDFHIKSFHLNDGRKFVCNINGCTKNFATQIALRNHAKTHTNTEDRPFKCDCCHRRFLYDSDKRKHMRIMHINGKTFACDKCDRTYYLEYDLNRHKVVHNEIKPWPCDECQATFISRHTLARHKKCHSNIKEYVCSICQKEFAIYEYLYAHMKTHGISSWNAKVYKKNPETPTEILLDKEEKST